MYFTLCMSTDLESVALESDLHGRKSMVSKMQELD